MIESAKVSIQACDEALELYNKIVDTIGASGHTKETESLIRITKTFTVKGISLYENAPKAVSEWCAETVPTLIAHTRRYKGGKDIVITALVNGLKVIEKSRDELLESSLAMNVVGGNLVTLENYLANDFNENATLINETVHTVVPELTKKFATISELFEGFVCTENKANKASRDIADLEVNIEVAKEFVPLDATHPAQAGYSVLTLIEKCNEYLKEYE